MAEDVKRPHYFNGQFLREPDFTLEQDYHVAQQRDHARLLHTPGIAEGLTFLPPAAGATAITINAGVAYDDQGHRIVLANSQTLDLADEPSGQTVYVTIAYQEQQSDSISEAGTTGNTRWTETPLIETSSSLPPDPSTHLVLAKVIRTGTTITSIETTDRRNAGVKGGDLAVRRLQLTSEAIAPAGWVEAQLGASGRADLAGSLRVAGDLTVTGSISGNIAVNMIETGDLKDNAVTSAKIAEADGTTGQETNTGSGVKTGHLQDGAVTLDKLALAARPIISIGGVGNPGGDVDLVGAAAITITPDDAANRITIGETHSALTGNPHGTTAAQVGALPALADQITMPGREGVIEMATAGRFGIIVNSRPSLDGGYYYGAGSAALAGVSNRTDRQGVRAENTSTGHALYVQGTAFFSGAKTGYVVDRFINGDDQALHTGDVVRLKGTPVVRFVGTQNKIPVLEVVLADQADDPRVIGVVDTEAVPADDEPDARTDPDDPTTIAPGGELTVVTLGCFSHCRVDATAGVIAVGDLLSTSSVSGCAGKTLNPAIGTILGKALEPMPAGSGYIAVFVNIQ